MKTRYEVLSTSEVGRICAAAFDIHAEAGVKCDYGRALNIFRRCGAQVDEKAQDVRLSEGMLRRAFRDAPSSFEGETQQNLDDL